MLGGKAKVLRTRDSGKVYQLRMWIEKEKRYLRETLKTKDLETALKRGEERVFQIYAEVFSGKKIFGITLKELVDKYLEWRNIDDVATGNITKGRLGTLSSHLKHLLAYKGDDTKIASLDRKSCFDYAEYRRKNYPMVRDVTIRNEEATINHLWKYAFRQGYSSFDAFEFRKTRVRTEDGGRDTFTLEEYDTLYRFMRKWTAEETIEDERVRLDRLLIRDCILIAANTMLRVGELWSLKWGDIVSYEKELDGNGRPLTLVTINVRAETSKVRKARQVTVRGGEFFKRLWERTEFKDKDDFIFCGRSGKERFPRNRLYYYWNELMNAIGIKYKERNLTWYSLRHFAITCRVKSGAPVYHIAKIAGTSVAFIESTYARFDQSMSREVALKAFSYSKREGAGAA